MRIDIENNNQSWHELFFRFPLLNTRIRTFYSINYFINISKLSMFRAR